MGDYELPTWAQTLGWLMAVAPVALIPIVAVWVVYKSYDDPCYDGLSFGGVRNDSCRNSDPVLNVVSLCLENSMQS